MSAEQWAVIVVLPSAVCAVGWAFLDRRWLRWILVICSPLLIAALFYWGPFLLGTDSLEAGVWAPIVITYWYCLSLPVAVLAYIITFQLRLRFGKRWTSR